MSHTVHYFGTNLHDTQGHPLPKGEENNRLNREELESRVIRPQELLGGRVEEEEGEEGDGDADVVDEGGVEVTLCHIPLTLMVFAPSLKCNNQPSKLMSMATIDVSVLEE